MILNPESLYHIYNRGNHKQEIFFNKNHYYYFLRKLKDGLPAEVDLLAYCLMPNHFHLLIATTSDFNQQQWQKAFRSLLSSYTKGINQQLGLTGSLFQQNSKMKEIETDIYAFVCFNYIHQNPLKAGLVGKMEDWPFSSFNEYWGNIPNDPICNLTSAKKLLGIQEDKAQFYKESYGIINNEQIAHFL